MAKELLCDAIYSTDNVITNNEKLINKNKNKVYVYDKLNSHGLQATYF